MAPRAHRPRVGPERIGPQSAGLLREPDVSRPSYAGLLVGGAAYLPGRQYKTPSWVPARSRRYAHDIAAAEPRPRRPPRRPLRAVARRRSAAPTARRIRAARRP